MTAFFRNASKPPGRRLISLAATMLGITFQAGCSRAPLFNLLGSYFPAWIFCMLLSILLTVVLRAVLKRFDIEPYFEPLVFTYPCLTACFAFTSWLLLFS